MDLLRINVTEKELKKFGLIFGPLAMAIAVWQASRGHWGHVYVLGPAGIYAFGCALIRPRWVFPLRWLLETVFKVFMWILTHAVLTVCFYVVFTPIGFLMRLMGKDLLNQRIDSDQETYWLERQTQDFDPGHYLKQF